MTTSNLISLLQQTLRLTGDLEIKVQVKTDGNILEQVVSDVEINNQFIILKAKAN